MLYIVIATSLSPKAFRCVCREGESELKCVSLRVFGVVPASPSRLHILQEVPSGVHWRWTWGCETCMTHRGKGMACNRYVRSCLMGWMLPRNLVASIFESLRRGGCSSRPRRPFTWTLKIVRCPGEWNLQSPGEWNSLSLPHGDYLINGERNRAITETTDSATI